MSNNNTTEELELLKKGIEQLEKPRQIEILRIIHKKQSNILNENKNGIYINMSSIDEEIIEELKQYMKYIYTQEEDLNVNEQIMQSFLNTFF